MVSVLMKKLAIAAVAGAVMVSASGCSLVSSGKKDYPRVPRTVGNPS